MENLRNYNQGNVKHLECSFEQNDGLDLSVLALDLSRKRNMPVMKLPEIVQERINITADSLHTAYTNTNKRCREANFSVDDGQIPIADNSMMLSPHCELSPLKKMKTIESADCCENNMVNHNVTLESLTETTPRVATVIPQQPSLAVPPDEANKLPTIIPAIAVLPAETTGPYATHNEAENKISLTIPTECSTSTDVSPTMLSQNTIKKVPRPFKAYPKNLLSVPLSNDYDSYENYKKFRDTVLHKIKETNATTNPKMRRVSKSPGLPTSTVDEKDAAYWERRRKNNEAAKRSREARRAKEDELAIRAAYYEHQYMLLKQKVKALEDIINHYNCLTLYQHKLEL
ncbi:hypothetical protein PUN28_011422 [Cardiocondyla obscurior]|uniref:BZIP domain-containing protein n=1 Tax=Cardiocondyla obscurior TaxID=286306 RepID=A0AAW2FJG4_9HYME